MKLYATVTSERRSRAARKGADETLIVELSAFGILLGEIVLDVMADATSKGNQYLLTYLPNEEGAEARIIEEGHREEGVIQRVKA